MKFVTENVMEHRKKLPEYYFRGSLKFINNGQWARSLDSLDGWWLLQLLTFTTRKFSTFFFFPKKVTILDATFPHQPQLMLVLPTNGLVDPTRSMNDRVDLANSRTLLYENT